MATWASRRKFTYLSCILITCAAITAAIFFTLFYKTPTCFDGKMNGSEQGVDCGGSCRRLCQSAFLPARIQWGGGKYEEVAHGLYNVAAYIVNPNLTGAAVNIPYKFSLFDSRGILIVERQGTLTLPPHRNALAFEPSVPTGERIPVKVTFEFLQAPQWFKSHDTLDGISILKKEYTEDIKSSALEVTLENKSLYPYKNIIVAVVLYDIDNNAIGFSRTLVDMVRENRGREIAPFTWPFSRDNKVVSIEVLPAVAPVRD